MDVDLLQHGERLIDDEPLLVKRQLAGGGEELRQSQGLAEIRSGGLIGRFFRVHGG